DLARQPALAEAAENVLVLQTTQLQMRRQLGQKREHLFVKKRIARLDGRVHGNAIALRRQEVAAQVNAAAPEEALVERVPAANARHRRLQIRIRQVIAQALEHFFAVEEEAALVHGAVDVLKRTGRADHLADAALIFES